jgi:hypothetical protein
VTRFWTCHWQNRGWQNDVNQEYDPVHSSGSNMFRARGVSVGDVIYIISLMDGQLMLGGRMTVERIASRSEAVEITGNENLWDAAEWVIGTKETGTPLNLHRQLVPALSRKIRFLSSNSEPTEVLFASETDIHIQGTRGIRELTEESAIILDHIIQITDALPRTNQLFTVTEEMLGDDWQPDGTRANHGEDRLRADGSHQLTELCIYTIKHSDDLNKTLGSGGSGTYTEKKQWAKGQRLLIDAKRTGKRLPIIFAPAEGTFDLFGWAFLDEIIPSETTQYTFSNLQLFDQVRPKTLLIKASDNKPLDKWYIRPYSICITPEFVIEAAARILGINEQNSAPLPIEYDDEPAPNNVPETVWREIKQRRGQCRFRTELRRAYGNRCAITDCDAEQALEAAHILRYVDTGCQEVRGGILLRADIHTLFDLDLIRIEPDTFKIALADCLKESTYAKYDGEKMRLPSNVNDQPDNESLRRRWTSAVNDKGEIP